ncbi:hypothetical protein, partial [Sphingomonas sp. Leaf339]|uniref:hypothetical protein n=1 Tax=Sphingomonas sp. Leaf339 TaxID=1736343 RepID=UPI001F3AA58B
RTSFFSGGNAGNAQAACPNEKSSRTHLNCGLGAAPVHIAVIDQGYGHMERVALLDQADHGGEVGGAGATGHLRHVQVALVLTTK